MYMLWGGLLLLASGFFACFGERLLSLFPAGLFFELLFSNHNLGGLAVLVFEGLRSWSTNANHAAPDCFPRDTARLTIAETSASFSSSPAWHFASTDVCRLDAAYCCRLDFGCLFGCGLGSLRGIRIGSTSTFDKLCRTVGPVDAGWVVGAVATLIAVDVLVCVE